LAATDERIASRIESMRDEILTTTGRLIQIESVNPRYPGTEYADVVGGEGDAARFMGAIYKEMGGDLDLVIVEPGRDNAVATFAGSGPGRSLILNGHVDVVPVGDTADWADGSPFSGRLQDGKIWGRGAADQKAGVVAQAMALAAIRREGIKLRGDVFIEAVVGEEVMDHETGVSATIRRGYRADAAIVSEPTAPPPTLSVVPTSPGLLWFTVTVLGKASHSSVRDELIRAGGGGDSIAVNAIEKALGIVQALQQLEQQWGISKRHPLFRPGHFTIHPGVISGGPHGVKVPFIISQICTIEYACWYNPDEDVEAVKAELAEQVHRACQLDPWLRENPAEITWNLHWPPFVTSVEDAIVSTVAGAHQHANGGTAEVRGGSVAGFCAVCDATFLSQAGISTVVYGPGSILQAHTANEWVDAEDIIRATRTFALATLDWCGEG
jgi:acetylornithine deacetylase/succinyl-diaminopimelate desuccinylase family protein